MAGYFPCLLIGLCLAALPLRASAAQGDIDRALLQLLGDVDAGSYLEQRRDEEIRDGLYEVRRGDALDLIIARAFPDTAIRRSVLRDAFVSINPQSFRNGNPNWLLAGTRLRIPQAEDIHALLFVDYATLRAGFNRDTSTWVRFP